MEIRTPVDRLRTCYPSHQTIEPKFNGTHESRTRIPTLQVSDLTTKASRKKKTQGGIEPQITVFAELLASSTIMILRHQSLCWESNPESPTYQIGVLPFYHKGLKARQTGVEPATFPVTGEYSTNRTLAPKIKEGQDSNLNQKLRIANAIASVLPI